MVDPQHVGRLGRGAAPGADWLGPWAARGPRAWPPAIAAALGILLAATTAHAGGLGLYEVGVRRGCVDDVGQSRRDDTPRRHAVARWLAAGRRHQ